MESAPQLDEFVSEARGTSGQVEKVKIKLLSIDVLRESQQRSLDAACVMAQPEVKNSQVHLP